MTGYQKTCGGRNDRGGESGNVLFLILIAVALFAALSYAVTQSSRSGSSDASSERGVISSAQITQYPAAIRTSVLRMIIGGVGADELYFNAPADFGAGNPIDDTDGDTTDENRSVFHPSGGGAPYNLAAPEVMADGAQGDWIFSADYQINLIGATNGTGAANDVIAFLPGISRSVCRQLNEQLGIGNTTDADGDAVPDGPVVANLPVAANNMTEANSGFPAAPVDTIGDAGSPDFSGQPFGCYDGDLTDATSTSPYVYYHVLVER